MTLKEFLENHYGGEYVRTGTTSQVLSYVKREQLEKPIKQIAPVNDEMIDIAI